MKKVRVTTTYAAASTTEELNLEFYQTYDPYFLYSRASSLLMAMDQPATERRRLAKLPVPRDIKKHLAALGADIYFTEMQQTEAFFALLFSAFQDLPHWVYLTEYKSNDLRAMIDSFVHHKRLDGTYMSEKSERELIHHGVYFGSIPQDVATASRWNENLDNILWLIRRTGERFVQSSEYNSYKHGVRVMAGPSYISFGLSGGTTAMRHASDHSVSHLQTVSTGPNVKEIRRETVHFSPVESWHHIAYLARMAATMQAVRLAALDQTANPPLIELFLTLDRDGLELMGRRVRFTIGA